MQIHLHNTVMTIITIAEYVISCRNKRVKTLTVCNGMIYRNIKKLDEWWPEVVH